MSFDPTSLLGAPRIVLCADLKPLIGDRFQPTGFPNLGAAEYAVLKADGSEDQALLIESPQSIANRLEATTWDEGRNDLVDVLTGLPFVRASVNEQTTNSILEAHRLNSPYLIQGLKELLQKRAGIADKPKTGKKTASDEDDVASTGVDRRKLVQAIFYYDPNSVLHGVFLEKIVGLARLTRLLSGFIEAHGVRIVASGGIKNDRIDPSGKAFGGAAKGFGNVPFARAEYTAKTIQALFSFDVALLRSYGLPEAANRLLLALGLWKIRRFLDDGARLRTACDLVVSGEIALERPSNTALPSLADLESEIQKQIAACRSEGLFADPAITDVTFAA